MEAVASGRPRNGAPHADGNFCILFNYKIFSRFVALIYFVMNEKNPKRILILCHPFGTFNYLEVEAPHQRFEPQPKPTLP